MKDYKHVIEKLDNYFKPKKNVMRLRQTFTRRGQIEHKDIEELLRELYKSDEGCNFTEKLERIRDQFLAGLREENLIEKLDMLYIVNNVDFTLDKVLEYSRTYEDIKTGRQQNQYHFRRSVNKYHLKQSLS